MIFGAVLAGGSGTRMKGAPLPKQFLPLGDCPILIRTLRVFAACPLLHATFVTVPAQWQAQTHALVQAHLPQANIFVVPGGADRTGSLFAAADAAQAQFGAHNDDLLVTHDAVRPFVTQQMLRDTIDGAQACGACSVAVNAIDTILESNDGQTIDRIPPRSRMYQMQTPQTFRIALLRRAFAALPDAQKATLTDGCGILVAQGLPVRLAAGSARNMKITTPDDYALAQALAAAAANG